MHGHMQARPHACTATCAWQPACATMPFALFYLRFSRARLRGRPQRPPPEAAQRPPPEAAQRPRALFHTANPPCLSPLSLEKETAVAPAWIASRTQQQPPLCRRHLTPNSAGRVSFVDPCPPESDFSPLACLSENARLPQCLARDPAVGHHAARPQPIPPLAASAQLLGQYHCIACCPPCFPDPAHPCAAPPLRAVAPLPSQCSLCERQQCNKQH